MPIKTRGRNHRGRPKKKQQQQPVIDQDGSNLNTENNQQLSSTPAHTPTTKYKPREERSYKDFYPNLNINQPLSIIRQHEPLTSPTLENGETSTKETSPSTSSKPSPIDLCSRDVANFSMSLSVSDEPTTAFTSTNTTDTESALSSVLGNGDSSRVSTSPSTCSTQTEQETTATTSTAGALWKEPIDGPKRQDDTYPALSSRLQVHHTTDDGSVDLSALPKPNFKKVTGDAMLTLIPKKKKTDRHSGRRRGSHQVDNMKGDGTAMESDTNDENDYYENNDTPSTSAKTGDYSRPENHYIRYTEPTEEALFDMVEYDMDEQDEAWLQLINNERQKENLGQVSGSFFENVIDKLEKEWFDLVKHLPKQVETGATLPEDSTCAICEDGECENSNAIVFCDGCNLAVHQDCYGVPYIPEGQWLCRKCMVSPDKPVSCLFCPNEGGAFKQTNTNKWGHLLCAIWIPEIGVSNSIYMEPIDNIDSIPKSRWKLTCYICKKRHGACIQCDNKHCFTAFHVTCARWARLCMRMKSHGTHYDSVQLKAYCDRHTPRDYRDEVDVERCVLAAQRFFGPKSQKNQTRLNYTSKQRHVDEMTIAGYTDDQFDGDNDSYDDIDDTTCGQSYDGFRSTYKELKRKGKQVHLRNKKRKSYAVTGTQQLTPSLKAARAHQHHYSAGAPIAPDYILAKLENSKSVRQISQLRKRSDLIASICRYWSLKRESRRGAPLLKRLHLEPWTASSSQFKKNETDMAYRAEAMMILRSDLERVRMLTEQVQKREKLKLESLRRQKEYVEMVLFPVEYMIKPILSQLMEMDKKEFFLYPVTSDVAPDYHEIIETPMAFSNIIEKLHNHEYTTIDSVECDLSLIWTNCKTYNRMETPYYRLAHRMEGIAATLMAQAREEYKTLDISRQSGVLGVGIDSDLFSYALASSIQETTTTTTTTTTAAATTTTAHDQQRSKDTDTLKQPIQSNKKISSSIAATTNKSRTSSASKRQESRETRNKATTLAPTPIKRTLRSSGLASTIGSPDEISQKTRNTGKAPEELTPTRRSKRIATEIPTVPASTVSATATIVPASTPTVQMTVPAVPTTATTSAIEATTLTGLAEGKNSTEPTKATETAATSVTIKIADSSQKAPLKNAVLKPTRCQDLSSTPLTSSSSSTSLSSASLGSSLSSIQSSPSTASTATPPTPTTSKKSTPTPSNRRVLRSAGPTDMTPLISSTKNKKISNELKYLHMGNLAMEPVQYSKGTRKSSTVQAPRGYQYLSSDDNDSNNDTNGRRSTTTATAAQQSDDKQTSLQMDDTGSSTRKLRSLKADTDAQPTIASNINRPRRPLSSISASPSQSTASNGHHQKLSTGKTKSVTQAPKKKLYKANPGEIVWARVTGFPYHPATIIDLQKEDISKHILKGRTSERNVLVKFYKVPDNHQWGWVKQTDVQKFGNHQDDQVMLENAKVVRGKKKSRHTEVLEAYRYVRLLLKKKAQKS